MMCLWKKKLDEKKTKDKNLKNVSLKSLNFNYMWIVKIRSFKTLQKDMNI